MPDNHGVTAGNTFSNNFISMAAGADGAHVVGGARLSSADLPHWTIEANVWAVDGNATLGMVCGGGGPDSARAGGSNGGKAAWGAAPGGCEAALAEVCPGEKGAGPACHACAMAHEAQLKADGCSFVGAPPPDIAEYCRPSGPGPHPGPPQPDADTNCVGLLPDSADAERESSGFASVDPQQFFQKREAFDRHDPTSFLPLGSGPLAGKGARFVNVSSAVSASDFFGKPRPTQAPSIGFAEPEAGATRAAAATAAATTVPQPRFSWETLPVFLHTQNTSCGEWSPAAAARAAQYPLSYSGMTGSVQHACLCFLRSPFSQAGLSSHALPFAGCGSETAA